MSEKLLRLFLGGNLYKQYLIGKNEHEDATLEVFVSRRLKVICVIKKLFLAVLMVYGGVVASDILSTIIALTYKHMMNIPMDKQTVFEILVHVVVFALLTVAIVRVIMGWTVKDGIHKNIFCYFERERTNYRKSVNVTKYVCFAMIIIGAVILMSLWFSKSISERMSIMSAFDVKTFQAVILITGLMFFRVIASFFLYVYALDGIMGTIYRKPGQSSLEGYIQTRIGMVIGILSAAVYVLYFWKFFWFHLMISFSTLAMYTKYRSIRQVLIVDFIYVVIIVSIAVIASGWRGGIII